MARAHLADLARVADRLATARGKADRVRLIADYLRGIDPATARFAVRLLAGRPLPETAGRRLALGGRAVEDALRLAGVVDGVAAWVGTSDFGDAVAQRMPDCPRNPSSLDLGELQRTFEAMAELRGKGSRSGRIEHLAAILERCAPAEAKLVVKAVLGDMRHGVQEGLLLDALAEVGGIERERVSRANQKLGDLGRLAYLVCRSPEDLDRVGVEIFRPLKPMLAQSASAVSDAFERMEGRLALEFKLDGARVQIHRSGDEVRLYSRRLQDVTASLPDVADQVRRGSRMREGILEGEVIAVSDDVPRPFQDLMRRFGRVRDIEQTIAAVPVQLHLFDALAVDGEPLVDCTAAERWDRLRAAAGDLRLVARVVPWNRIEAERFYENALERGHEGVMAKSLSAPYLPGNRGSHWLKVKRNMSLDLAIIAAEWGYGRRSRWLSNYHLAARDQASGELVAVGKTFKGPTDRLFAELTERMQELATKQVGGTVHVRPEVVVEVRFDDVQRSPRYPGGFALRFARIVRVRDDKQTSQVDSLDAVRAAVRHASREDEADEPTRSAG